MYIILLHNVLSKFVIEKQNGFFIESVKSRGLRGNVGYASV